MLGSGSGSGVVDESPWWRADWRQAARSLDGRLLGNGRMFGGSSSVGSGSLGGGLLGGSGFLGGGSSVGN